MNLWRVFQLSLLILLEFCGTRVNADEAVCLLKPFDVKKVDVLVYVNGETGPDNLWYSRYCSWLDKGFPYNTYAPVTIKVGAEITCDGNNKCKCPSYEAEEADCSYTFRNVCAEQILGQHKFKKLLCCTGLEVDKHLKGFDACVKEQPGLEEKIAECLKKEGDGSPRDLALKNAKEVIDAGVDVANTTEPIFFYNKIFDKCISEDSRGYFLQKICGMLNHDIAKSIKQCVTAMGWH